jgi:hypothetical protein
MAPLTDNGCVNPVGCALARNVARQRATYLFFAFFVLFVAVLSESHSAL